MVESEELKRKAGDATRTRDIFLGKEVLYQLSYTREERVWKLAAAMAVSRKIVAGQGELGKRNVVRVSSAKPEWLLALVVLGFIHLGFSRTFGQQNQTSYGSLLRESSLSTAHVRRDFASQARSTTHTQLTNTPGSNPVAASRSVDGTNFQFRHQPSSELRAASDAVAEKLAAKAAQEREAAQNPFWNAAFWTKSPVAILGYLLGGDKHRLETPPTERERLSYSDYAYGAAIDKYEKTLRFDQPTPRNKVVVGKLAP